MSTNSLNWLSTQSQSYQPLKVKHSSLILALIILMFIGDAANTVLLKTGSSFWRVSIFVRILALLYFTLLLIKVPQGRNLLKILIILLATFLIGAFSTYMTENHYEWFENINIMTKMIFFFVCWQTFRLYFKSPSERSWLFKVFEFLILIQLLSILIGFIFDIDLFHSYSSFKRFGYKGLIPARNELSGFLLISFFYFVWKVKTYGRGVLSLFLVLISGLLTGSKVAISLPIIFTLLLGYWSLIRNKRYVFFIVLFMFLVFFTLVIWQWDYILQLITPTINYFKQQLAYGHNPSLLSIFFSGRDLLVKNLLNDLHSNLNLVTMFFGGHELSKLSSETDLIDTFLFIGLLGTMIFYIFYIKTLLYCEGKRGFIQLLFVITWLIVSTFAGHLVFSAINSSYLAILVLAFSRHETGKNVQIRLSNASHLPQLGCS